MEMAMPSRDFLYYQTNDVGSRDACIDIPVPSLIWNRSYLIPKRPKFDTETSGRPDIPGRRFSLPEVRESIDAAILSFLRSGAGHGYRVEPSIGTDIVLFNDAYDAQSVSSAGKAVPLAARARSSEHIRLLEADERALVLLGTYATAGRRFDVRMKVHLRTNLFTISIVATPVDAEGFPEMETKRDFDDLTIGFWNEYSDHVLTSYPFRRDFVSKALQSVFADSRGVIVSSKVVVDAMPEPSNPAVSWAEPVIEQLAPLLSPADDKDLTATYLIDKQALSVTTFGSAAAVQTRGRIPLTFVMCVRDDLLCQDPQSWARLMGHVMSRSHTITTMRLAALLDMKLLRQASTDLAKVDDLKGRVRKLITDYDNHEIEGGPARLALEDLRNHLAQINADFLSQNAAGVGLTFRIESSRYYIEEFKKNVEALHLSPIEGYQSYSQTIDRNVGLIFEFITRLGVRYDRLLNEMAIIEQSFASVQTRHTGNLIAEIQRVGELILIGGLLPYYGIGIVSHVFGAPETREASAYIWRMIYATIWMALTFIALFRHKVAVGKATKLRSPASRIELGSKLAFLSLILTALLCTAVRYWPSDANASAANEQTSTASCHPSDTSAGGCKDRARRSPLQRPAE